MSIKLQTFNKAQEKQMPDIRPGDTVRVHQKIKEGDKERIQICFSCALKNVCNFIDIKLVS